jgi:Reverse transcriptase (RNA-dependent DNA polymerase)
MRDTGSLHPLVRELSQRYLDHIVWLDGEIAELDKDDETAMLDVLDKELERRGHRFARYADDCNIYVCSLRAGERVMASVERFLERRLKLRINRAKSAVAPPPQRSSSGSASQEARRPPWTTNCCPPRSP